MINKLIIANFKSNKTSKECMDWLGEINSKKEEIIFQDKKIIICPSFPSLSLCYSYIRENNLSISLGVQNISEFDEGPYTGEVAARQVNEFAEYAIIGHSERRNLFYETDETIQKKVNQAQKNNLKCIVCIQNETSYIPIGSEIIAYEPNFAIGTGNPESPEKIREVLSKINQKTDKELVYGGSVDNEDIESFLNIKILSGFLVGNASLDPDKFISLVNKI